MILGLTAGHIHVIVARETNQSGVAGEIRLLPVTDLLAPPEALNGKLRPTAELAALGGHPNLLPFLNK